MTEHCVPASKCPSCKVVLNAATPMDSLPGGGPSPGDFGLCFSCGKVNVYKEDLTLRSATDEETSELIGRIKSVAKTLGTIH